MKQERFENPIQHEPDFQKLPIEIYAGIVVGFLISSNNKEKVKKISNNPLDDDLAYSIIDLMGDWEKPNDRSTEYLRFEAFKHFDLLLNQKDSELKKIRKSLNYPINQLVTYLKDAKKDNFNWDFLLDTLERESGYIPSELRGRKKH